MRRKLYVFIGTILVFSSCINNTHIMEEDNQEIDFNPVVHKVNTRSNNYPSTIPFGAYAWYGTSMVANDINTVPYMENVEINNVNGFWKPSVAYYWPIAGNLDFFCYSPAFISPQINTSIHLLDNYIEYKDIDLNQDRYKTDIMYSSKENHQTNISGNNTVSIRFHHALAKVKFNLKSTLSSAIIDNKKTTWEVKLNELQVRDIKTKGNLKMHLYTDKKSWLIPSSKIWDITADSPNFKWTIHSYTDESIIITTEGRDFTPTFVLPQDLTGIKLYIKYSITESQESKEPVTTIQEKEIALTDMKDNNGNLTKWEINKIITYYISINPSSKYKPIRFNPEIQDWNNYEPSIEF